MAKIALVYSPLGGHAGPIRRLGGALVRQGHHVVEFSYAGDVVDVPPDAASQPSVVPAKPLFDPLKDPVQIATILAEATVVLTERTVEVLHRASPDLVLYDVVVPWGRIAASWLGLPMIASHPTFPGGIRSQESGPDLVPRSVRDEQAERLHGAREQIASVWGVEMGDWLDVVTNPGDLNVVFTTPELLGDVALDDSFRFVGPLMDPSTDGTEPLLADWGDEPLVYMALGTMFTGRREVFAAVLEGLADLPVRLLVSTWGRFTAEDLAPVPANARIAGSVDSRAVLREARLHITHGGASSVHESLMDGVPMLCLPQGKDQEQWSAAVEAAGGARVLADDSADAIRASVTELLHDEAIHLRAAELARSLAAYDGERIAAQAVEEVLQAS